MESIELAGPDPTLLFLRFAGWGMFLFIVIRLLRYLLPILLYKERYKQFLMKAFPVGELIFWLAFLSWFIFLFSEANVLYAYVVLAVLLMILFWISRFWIKDLIAGVIFRSSTRLKVGDQLHYGEIKGTINKFGNFSLELETQDNQTVFIPYAKLVDAVNIKSERTGQSKGYTFSLECSRQDDLNGLTNRIKSTIITSPWASANRIPVITLIDQTADIFTFEITVFPIDKTFTGKLEALVKEKYSAP